MKIKNNLSDKAKRNYRNKPIKNFQKKKYYINRNEVRTKSNAPKTKELNEIYCYDPLKREWYQKSN